MGSVMCGRRGAVGSATAEDVLAGKTFSSDKGVNIAGTMPDRGQYQYTKTMRSGNGYYALNGIPEGCYRAEGQSWAPEIRIAVDDAKNSQMWNDAYNNGFANRGYTTRSFDFSGVPIGRDKLTTLEIDISLSGYSPVSAGITAFSITKNHVSGSGYANFVDNYSASLSGNTVTISARVQWNNVTPTFNGTIIVGYIQD